MKFSRKISMVLVFAMIVSIFSQGGIFGTLKAEAASDLTTEEVMISTFDNPSDYWSCDGVTAAEAKAVQVTFNKTVSGAPQWMNYEKTLSEPLDVSSAQAFKIDIKSSAPGGDATNLLRFKLSGDGGVYYDGALGELGEGWNTVTITPMEGVTLGTLTYITFYVDAQDTNWGDSTAVTYTVDNLRAVMPGEGTATTEQVISSFDTANDYWPYTGVSAVESNASQVTFDKTVGNQWMNYEKRLTLDVSAAQTFKVDINVSESLVGTNLLKFKLMGESDSVVYYDGNLGELQEGWNTVTITPIEGVTLDTLSYISFYVDGQNANFVDSTATYTVDNLRAVVPVESAGLTEQVISSFDNPSDYWSCDGVTAAEAKAVQVTFDKTVSGAPQWMNYEKTLAEPLDVSSVQSFKFDIKPSTLGGDATNLLKFKLSGDNGVYYDGAIGELGEGWNTVTIAPIDGVTLGILTYITLYVDAQDTNWGESTAVTYTVDNLRAVMPGEGTATTEQVISSFDAANDYWPYTGVSAVESNASQVTFDKTVGNQWMNYEKRLTLDVSAAQTFKVDINVSESLVGTNLLKFKLMGESDSVVYYDGNLGELQEGWNTVTITPIEGVTLDTLSYISFYVDGQDANFVASTATYTVDNFRAVVPDNGESSEVYTQKFEGFEDESAWQVETGITKTVENNLKTEGEAALQLKFDTATSSGQWIHTLYKIPDPLSLDLSTAKGLYIDVYPTSQTSGDSEPLVVKIMDSNSKGVYEMNMPKLTANQWNTVFIDFTNIHWQAGNHSKINTIELYADSIGTQWEGRTDVTYILDNMTIAQPSEPVITANIESGVVPKGSIVQLSTELTGTIYYTTDGSNPLTSETKQEYVDGITINENKLITAAINNSFFHIYKYMAESPINIEITSNEIGNIFTTDCIFNVALTNMSPLDRTLTVEYIVKDYRGYTVYQESEAVVINANATNNIDKTISDLENNVYELTVNVYNANDDVYETMVESFSKVLPLMNDRGDGIFGVCTHFGLGRGDVDKNLPIAALGGMQLIRDEMRWAQAETTKGTVLIQASWDSFINKSIENGLEPFVILAYGNPLYAEDGKGDLDFPSSPEAIDAFVNYVSTVVTHYTGKVKYFELWNEPNLNAEGAVKYAELLKAVYPAIKAANPNAVLVSGCVSGTGTDWLRVMFEADDATEQDYAYKYMDALSIHPYSWPTGPEAGGIVTGMQDTIDLMDEFKGDDTEAKPLWISENGWPSHVGERSVTDLTNADYLTRMYVVGLASGLVEKIFWYDLQDDGTNETYSEDKFGMIENWFDPQTPYAAKLNYVAYNAMTNQLIGAEFVDKSTPDANLNLYKFHRASDNKDVLVAWNTFSSKTIGLNVGEGSFRVTDMLGNTKNYNAVNGVINVKVSDSLVYIEGVIDTYSVASSATYSIGSSTVNVLAGTTFNLEINHTQDSEGNLNVTLPDGWAVVGSTEFESGTDPIALAISVPNDAEKASYDIDIEVVSKDWSTTYAELAVEAVVADAVMVDIVPAPVGSLADGKWSLNVTVSNISENAVSGTINVLEPNTGWAESIVPVDFDEIAPGAEQVVNVPVGTPDQKIYDVMISVVLSNGYTAEFERKTSFLAVDNTENTITVDGTLSKDEWSGSTEIMLNTAEQYLSMWPLNGSWGELTDLSGKGSLKMDSSNLYFSIEVIDNQQSQPYPSGADAWRGDSIQFAIDPYRADGPSIAGNNHEVTLALYDDGIVQAYRGTATAGKQSGDMDIDCAIVRNEDAKTTTYEAAIPWSELLPDGVSPAAGDVYGFSFLINDNDYSESVGYNDRTGGLTYMGGIGDGKDPSKYGDLVLAETPTQTNPSTPTIDTLAPVLDTTDPVDDATSVALDKAIAITFDENIIVTGASITLKDNQGSTVASSVSSNAKVLTIDPNSNLSYNTTYTVTVPAGAIRDAAGNINSTEIEFSFTTVRSGSSDSNGDNNTTNTTIDTSEKNDPVVSDKGTIMAKPTVDSKTGIATIEINTAVLEKAKEKAKANEKGVKTIGIQVEKAVGAKEYKVILPVDAVSAGSSKDVIDVETDIATLELSANMLQSDAAKGVSTVALSIAKADTSLMTAELKEKIGNKPVVELKLIADNKQVEWNNPDAPVTVSIDYKPTEEELKNPEHIVIWYIDGAGKINPVPNGKYNVQTGKVVFTTTHFSSYAVAFVNKTFSDAGKYKWAQKQIEVLASKGIIDATENTYKPETNITRGEFISMLVKAFGLSAKIDGNFVDVEASHKYYQEIAIAKKLGITKGVGKNAFSPDESISRQDMFVLAEKVLTLSGDLTVKGNTADLKKFSDEAKVASYAKQSIANLVKAGIVNGDGKGISPTGKSTKAATAAIVYNLISK